MYSITEYEIDDGIELVLGNNKERHFCLAFIIERKKYYVCYLYSLDINCERYRAAANVIENVVNKAYDYLRKDWDVYV